MRNLKNKKLLAPVIAGVLATMMIIGIGTFAWFTAKTTVDIDGEFYSATVAIDDTAAEFNAYDFYPGTLSPGTRAFQNILESMATDNTRRTFEFPGRLTSLYSGWVGDPLRNIITALDVPLAAAPAAHEVILIQNPFNKQIDNSNGGYQTVYNITPGTILEAKYSFTIDNGASSVPVYFRISKTELIDIATGAGTSFDYEANYMASITGTNNPANPVVSMFGTLLDSGDGFYVCPVPLYHGYGWEVEVVNTAYIFGETNNDDGTAGLQGQTVKFSGIGPDVTVELIQATNNAAFYADGWKNVAASLVAYVDAALYQSILTDWTGTGYPIIIP